jgi:hypothetical protein
MGSEAAGAIETALQAIDRNAFALLVALSGVGIVTMALLQLVKDLLPSRRAFQRRWFERWFMASADRAMVGPSRAGDALRSLIDLATAGDAKALYDLPVEQFAGQINAAVQSVLDYPERYGDVMRILAQRADPEDIEGLCKGRPAEKDQEGEKEYQAAIDGYLQQRNRVAQHIQRSLDAIQIAMGGRWRAILQWLSVMVSTVIIMAALTVYGGREFWTGTHFAYALLAAVLGGFIAPVARDLVAAIESLRNRPR